MQQFCIDVETGLSKTEPQENPLVPNKKLRQMYTAMLEARLLDRHIADLQRRTSASHRPYSTHGQEACRVTTTTDLRSGDLVSDVQPNAVTELLLGARLGSLLRRLSGAPSDVKASSAQISQAAVPGRLLPWSADLNADDRLKLAVGAALSLKTLRTNNIVIAYVDSTEIPHRTWKPILHSAAKLILPIIFVVLPSSDKDLSPPGICVKARSAGVPGIPVDASDAVALYRVAQESIGRARGGDGPVLIECIAPQLVGQRPREMDDPIVHMKNFMIGRRVCSEHWANHAADAFARKLHRRSR